MIVSYSLRYRHRHDNNNGNILPYKTVENKTTYYN